MELTASIVSDFWDHQLVEHRREAVFCVLVGFVGSFAFVRMSTRIARSPRFEWWPGSIVSEGGVHVHHLVPGIFLMIGAATVGFAVFAHSPWFEISALLFGIGAGLTVDEFALWLYLDDVYWAEQGRGSVDATVLATAVMAMVVFGANPFAISTEDVAVTIGSFLGAALVLVQVTICFLKQRVLHGVVGLFVPPISLYGAIRIGKPGSPWARRFYGERNPGKQAKAERRFRPDRRTDRFKNRFRDLVGGVPTEQYEAKLGKRDVG